MKDICKMYVPKYNLIKDSETIFRFMQENGFAIVVSTHEGLTVASHLPVEIEENENGEKILRTHMAKANLQWQHFAAGSDALVIFNGPHTYISSSWYDHVNVPTWNYIAVHVYGKVRLLNDEEATDVLQNLVTRYEKNSEHPFRMEQLDEKFMASHLKAMVALEISMDRIDAKEKLSQNRNEHNYNLILEQLEKRDDAQSAALKKEMERVKQTLFTK